jgi:two-component system nitrogen regulation response regulator NtrX
MDAGILIVDDDPLFTEQVASLLANENYDVTREHTSSKVISLLQQSEFAVILLDIQMPAPDGLTLLKEIIKKDSHPEIIMVSGAASLQEAADSVKIGAADFLEKPPDVKRLLTAVKNAAEKYKLKSENLLLKSEKLKKYEIIGESRIIQDLCKDIRKVAESDSNVLVWGETGTGKELAAAQIHYYSAHSSKPLVRLNCASIPAELAESELFGHKRGAFTGAYHDKKGKFEMADGGTLVLDEIAELPLPLQSKLLRVLETSELEVIGSTGTVKIDVRLISISGKDLEAEIKQGRFRSDLYYRINTIPIHIPPLRERKEDVPLLFEHFFEALKSTTGQFERNYDTDIMPLLISHSWPGNVRELRNFTERLFFMCRDQTIESGYASEMLSHLSDTADKSIEDDAGKNILTRTVNQFERSFLKTGLDQAEGNVSELAHKLGVDRGNLYRKLKKYGLL